MAYEIVVKKRFLNKLVSTLSYLEKEWGTQSASQFLEKIDRRIEALKHHPYIGAPSGKLPDVHGLLITKHNRLYYKIEGNKVILLNLYDTRQEQ